MTIYVADLSTATGWTERWKTTEGALSAVAGPALRITKSAYTGIYMVSLDAVDSDANRNNAEVLAKVRFNTQAAAVTMCGIGVRGSGATGSENFYSCLLYDAGNDGGDSQSYIGSSASGSFSMLARVTGKSNVAGTWYWMRLRVNGTSIKARTWVDGSGEPSSWDVDTTDSSVSLAGWIGFIGMDSATDTYDLGYFAVATNGDSLGDTECRVRFIGV